MNPGIPSYPTMKYLYKLSLILIALCIFYSCKDNKITEVSINVPPFPYQSYLDSMAEDQMFPSIGNDGEGFNAISHNIVYPEIPDSLIISSFADSLLQLYNITLAFNTMAYDVGTAERYIEEKNLCLDQANALDSINLTGIKIPEIKDLIHRICKKGARAIREGKKPNEQEVEEFDTFYDAFSIFSDPLYAAYLKESEYNVKNEIPDYEEVHLKAITDTISFKDELLLRVLSEKDFQKQCILAREFAYSNYNSPNRDDKQVVTVLDMLLKSNKYSPLLGELWRMWRCLLQINILGSRSNDGAIYNLFYNQMKNRVAMVYISHLKSNPHDKIAFKEFARLVWTHNIVRNSGCLFGNNGNLEDMELFYDVFNVDNGN